MTFEGQGIIIGLDFPMTDMLWKFFGISDFFTNEILMWNLNIIDVLITMMLVAK